MRLKIKKASNTPRRLMPSMLTRCYGLYAFKWKAYPTTYLSFARGSRALTLSVPDRQPIIPDERPPFPSSDRPTLVSEDNVDRVPWLSMRHPEFQKSKEESCNPNHAIGDIRGITQVSERFLLMLTCNVCGKGILREISKNAYYHGVVVLKCSCCGWLHLVSDATGLFQECKQSSDIERLLQKLSCSGGAVWRNIEVSQ